MPLLGTTGAASAKGFGFGAAAGGETYWFQSGFTNAFSVVDSTGNIYYAQGAVIAKYTKAGVSVWANTYSFSDGTSRTPDFRQLALDSSDNLYAIFQFTITTGEEQSGLIKINPSTGAETFSKWFQGAALGSNRSPIKMNSLAIGPGGEIYVAGYAYSYLNFTEGETVAKLTTSGAVTWSSYGGDGGGFGVNLGTYYVSTNTGVSGPAIRNYDDSTGAFVDNQYNTSMPGISNSTPFTQAVRKVSTATGESWTVSRNSAGGQLYLTKLSSFSSVSWTKYVTVSLVYNSDVCIDSSGNSYVTWGRSGKQYVAKFNTSGTQQWTRSVSKTSIEAGSINLNAAGTVMVFGYNNYSKLPSDGTKTGTYGSYTYASETVTFSNLSGWSTDSSYSSYTVPWSIATFTSTTVTSTSVSTTLTAVT